MIVDRVRFIMKLRPKSTAGKCILCGMIDFAYKDGDLLEHYPNCILAESKKQLFHITPIIGGLHKSTEYGFTRSKRLNFFCHGRDVYGDKRPKGTPAPWTAWRWREIQAKVYGKYWANKLWH